MTPSQEETSSSQSSAPGLTIGELSLPALPSSIDDPTTNPQAHKSPNSSPPYSTNSTLSFTTNEELTSPVLPTSSANTSEDHTGQTPEPSSGISSFTSSQLAPPSSSQSVISSAELSLAAQWGDIPPDQLGGEPASSSQSSEDVSRRNPGEHSEFQTIARMARVPPSEVEPLSGLEPARPEQYWSIGSVPRKHVSGVDYSPIRRAKIRTLNATRVRELIAEWEAMEKVGTTLHTLFTCSEGPAALQTVEMDVPKFDNNTDLENWCEHTFGVAVAKRIDAAHPMKFVPIVRREGRTGLELEDWKVLEWYIPTPLRLFELVDHQYEFVKVQASVSTKDVGNATDDKIATTPVTDFVDKTTRSDSREQYSLMVDLDVSLPSPSICLE